MTKEQPSCLDQLEALCFIELSLFEQTLTCGGAMKEFNAEHLLINLRSLFKAFHFSHLLPFILGIPSAIFLTPEMYIGKVLHGECNALVKQMNRHIQERPLTLRGPHSTTAIYLSHEDYVNILTTLPENRLKRYLNHDGFDILDNSIRTKALFNEIKAYRWWNPFQVIFSHGELNQFWKQLRLVVPRGKAIFFGLASNLLKATVLFIAMSYAAAHSKQQQQRQNAKKYTP